MKLTKMEALELLREMVLEQENTAVNNDLVAWIDGQKEVTAAALAKDKMKRDAKKAAAGPDELTEIVYSLLTDAPQSIPDIIKQIDGPVTAPLITTRLTALIKAGKATKATVKEPKTENSPAHTYMVYTRL